MKYYLGIDPGLTGAAALMDANGGLVGVFDLPVIRDGALAWIWPVELCRELSELVTKADANYDSIDVWIERVSAMPKQGVASSFNFGVSFGSILGILMTRAAMPINFVTASKWKRDLALSKDKHASLDKARLLYPTAELHLAKHDGRAEAILIAHWARTQSRKP